MTVTAPPPPGAAQRLQSLDAPTDRFRVPPPPPATDAPTVRVARTVPTGANGDAAGPTGAGRRVRGVDAARGLALLGMIAVHTLPTRDAADDASVATLVAGGTSAALFGFLVGVSVAFLTGRRRASLGAPSATRDAARLAVRGVAIGTLGLALGQAGIGDVDIILTYYGVLFLLAIPLVLLSTRALFVLGAALVVVAPMTGFLLRGHLAPFELIDPSFTALVDDPGGLLTALLFTGAYPAWPWMAYLCVGVAVGRCSLGRTRTAVWLTVTGVAATVAAVALSHLALTVGGGMDQILADPGLSPDKLAAGLSEGTDGVTPTTTWWWLAVDTPHSSTPLDLLRTIGTSLAVLGVMLLADRGLDRTRTTTAAGRIADAAFVPLAAAGSMTLTFYTLHVVVVGVAPETAPWVLYLVQVVGALLVGALWCRRVGRGPLEAAVGRLVDALAPPPARDRDAREPRATALPAALALAVLALVLVAAAQTALVTTPATASVSSAAIESTDTADSADTAETGADADTGDDADTPAATDATETGDTADEPTGEDATGEDATDEGADG